MQSFNEKENNLEREDAIYLSLVLPCRNENVGLGKCVEHIRKTLENVDFKYEIIVSDSSQDGSHVTAEKEGCVVVKHDLIGYGIACRLGIRAARGIYVIMADADDTYDFTQIPEFLCHLEKNSDLVVGNRLAGKMEKNSMPWLHRYIGNPSLSFVLRLLFNSSVRDSQCGIRGFKKQSIESLNLCTEGMEFASEMIAKAEIKKLIVSEIPVGYRCRVGDSKLRPIQDGLRHLRFFIGFFIQQKRFHAMGRGLLSRL